MVGVVLDSPVIDWADVVAFQGGSLGLPGMVSSGAIQVLGHRWGGVITGQSAPIDFDRLNFVRRAAELDLPESLLLEEEAELERMLAEREAGGFVGSSRFADTDEDDSADSDAADDELVSDDDTEDDD